MALKVDFQHGLIRITASDVISWKDVLEMGAVIRELELKQAVAPNRLMDLSGGTGANIDFPAVATFAGTRNSVVLNNKVRVSIFAPTDMHFGVARMFQTLLTNPQIELQIFRSLDEAARWAQGG